MVLNDQLTFEKADDFRISFELNVSGSTTVLKESTPVQANEILDATLYEC